MTLPWWFWFFPGGIFALIALLPVFGTLAKRARERHPEEAEGPRPGL